MKANYLTHNSINLDSVKSEEDLLNALKEVCSKKGLPFCKGSVSTVFLEAWRKSQSMNDSQLSGLFCEVWDKIPRLV